MSRNGRPPALLGAVVALAVAGAAVVAACDRNPADHDGDSGSGVSFGRATPRSPAIALDEIITVAARVPPSEAAHEQLIYLRTENGWAHTSNGDVGDPQDRSTFSYSEHWVSPEGMIEVANWYGDDRDGHPIGSEITSHPRDEVAAAVRIFEEEGPSLTRPTPQFLAALPTDPAELRRVVLDRSSERRQARSLEYTIVDAVGETFWFAEPVITSPVRVAFYRMIFALPDISVAEFRHDGRRLLSVRASSGAESVYLFLDPTSGRVAGASLAREGEPGERSWSFWTHAVVGSIGDRPAVP